MKIMTTFPSNHSPNHLSYVGPKVGEIPWLDGQSITELWQYVLVIIHLFLNNAKVSLIK